METSEDTFFENQTSSSRIKANIVAEYFPKYCRILMKKGQPEIRYLDLFAGPGKYEDGNFSTPILLAQACAEDDVLSQKVFLMFNDKNHSEKLKTNFNTCFPEGTFLHSPRFANKIVGEDKKIENYLRKDYPKPNPHPTLLFFDPYGYKGIDTLVLAKFLSHWGNEIFLFVNTKRINAAIENNKFDELMQILFPTTIDKLRNDKKYKAIKVHERLSLIMENLANEFKNSVKGKLYHCAFKFQEEDSVATSHYIIHFTKHAKGYELVKQIYYDFDNIGATLENDGNYAFDAKKMGENSLLNFGDQNIQILSEKLEKKYKGRIVSARALFDEHQPGTSWCGSHYLTTLRHMVELGKLKATFTDQVEHKVSVLLTNSCKLEFK
jgi:three-Cys-motif partner protein